jgi:hypothetical protein
MTTNNGDGDDDLGFAIKVDDDLGFSQVWKGNMSSGTGHMDLNFRYSFNLKMEFSAYDIDSGNDLIGVIRVSSSNAGTGEHVQKMVSVINSREPQNSPEIFLQLAVQEKAA